jgi:hypothetical protein
MLLTQAKQVRHLDEVAINRMSSNTTTPSTTSDALDLLKSIRASAVEAGGFYWAPAAARPRDARCCLDDPPRATSHALSASGGRVAGKVAASYHNYRRTFPDRHSGGFPARHDRPAWASPAVVCWRWELGVRPSVARHRAGARVPLLSTARGVGVGGDSERRRGREDRARPRRLGWLPCCGVRAVQHMDAGRLTAAAVATALARAL